MTKNLHCDCCLRLEIVKTCLKCNLVYCDYCDQIMKQDIHEGDYCKECYLKCGSCDNDFLKEGHREEDTWRWCVTCDSEICKDCYEGCCKYHTIYSN